MYLGVPRQRRHPPASGTRVGRRDHRRQGRDHVAIVDDAGLPHRHRCLRISSRGVTCDHASNQDPCPPVDAGNVSAKEGTCADTVAPGREKLMTIASMPFTITPAHRSPMTPLLRPGYRKPKRREHRRIARACGPRAASAAIPWRYRRHDGGADL
jgi:hypothetical protein